MEQNNLFEHEPEKGGFLKTQGFYIVLALCLLIVGAAVAVTALPIGEEPMPTAEQVVESNQSNDETLFERATPTPKLSATPQPSMQVILPTAAPTLTPSPVPASSDARPARKGSAPVSGSVQWSFAMESLLYSRTLDQWTTHAGIDIAADLGSEVKAVLSGTVAAVFEDDALGTTVTVLHTNDRLSLYANLDEQVAVTEGQKLNEGDVIGTVGSTSRAECGDAPHLHFGFFVKEQPVDPTQHVDLG